MAKGKQITIGVGVALDKSSVASLKNELQAIQQMTKNEYKAMSGLGSDKTASRHLNDMKKSAELVQQALNNSFNVDLGTVNITKLRAELDKIDITRLYNNFKRAGAIGLSAFNTLSSATMNANLQLKESHTLLNKMAETMGNTVKWGITSSIFNNMTGSIQKAWDYTKNLDSSLNDIRIVTGKSADEMERFAKVANKAAGELGKSTKDYSDAALIYYQQGLSDEEAQERANITLKTSNVTGQSTSDVSEQLTAVWNGYKVQTQEAEMYIDKLAAVAASTASDLEELSTGMGKVASAAAMMGVDIDQLNATLATVVSVTRQAPESVGTAFKTIYARMGDIEAGLDTETTLDSYTEKVKEISGINVLNFNGQLRDMGEIIEEVGNKWSSFSREQQVALSQAMAGTRQYNNLLALFDNWDMYEKAVDTSKNSLGTLQQQQDIYMDSTEAHLEKLDAAWERVWNSMVDADSTNGLIDVLTALTNGMANFVEAIGGGGSALMSLGAIATRVFSKQITGAISTSIHNMQASKFNTQQLREQLEALKKLKEEAPGDKGTETRYKSRLEMESYIGHLNREEILEYNKLIDEYAAAVAKEEMYTERRRQAKEFISNTVGGNQSDKKAENILNVNNEADFEKYATEVEENRLLLNSVEKAVQDVREAYAKYGADVKVIMGNVNEVTQKDISDSVQLTKSMTAVNSAFKVLESTLEDLEGTKFSFSVGEHIEEAVSSLGKIDKKTKTFKKGSADLEKRLIGVEGAAKRALDMYEAEAGMANKVLDEEREHAGKAGQAYKDAAEEKKKLWENKNKEGLQLVQIEQVVNAIGAIESIGAAVMSVTNLTEIWGDETLSTGQKILQTFMMAGNVIGQIGPIALNAVKAVNAASVAKIALAKTELKLGKDKSIAAMEEAIWENQVARAKKAGYIPRKMSIDAISAENKAKITKLYADKAETDALIKAKAAQDAYNASVLMNPYLWLAVAIIAAIGAIALNVWALVDAYNADANAAKRAAQSTKELTDDYNELNEKAKELRNTLKDWTEVKKNIEDLEKGTDEYREAIEAANAQAEQLIETYKLFDKYSLDAETGLIEIDPDALAEAQAQQQEAVDRAKVHKNAMASYAAKADVTSKTTDLRRKIDADLDWDSMNSEIQDTAAVIQEFRKTKEEEKGSTAASTEEIKKYLLASNKVPQTVKDHIDAVMKDVDGLVNLGEAMEQATAAAKHYAQTVVGEIIEDKYDSQIKQMATDKDGNVDQTEVELIKSLVAANSEDLTNLMADTHTTWTELVDKGVDSNNSLESYLEMVGSEYAGKDFNDKETALTYAKLKFNLDSTAGLTYKGGNGKGTVIDADGNELFTDEDDEVMRRYIAREEGFKYFESKIKDSELSNKEDVLSVYKKMDENSHEETMGADFKSSILNASINKKPLDFSTVFNSISDSEKFFLETISATMGQIDGGKMLLENLGLTEEDIKALGWESGAAFAKDFGEAIGKWDYQAWFDQIQKAASTGADSAGTLITNIQSGDTTKENIKDDESYKSLLESLEKVKDAHIDLEAESMILKKTWLVGTQEYNEALEKVQDAMYKLDIESMAQQAADAGSKVEEEWKKIIDAKGNIKVDADLEDFTKALNEVLDKNYEIDVRVHTEADQEFDSITNALDNMYDMADKIGDEYIVAAEDIRELNNAFPGILDGMQILKDGTVKLNADIVKSAMGTAEAEAKADAQATIEKLNNQAALLRAKQKVYTDMANAALILAKGETATEEEAATARATISGGLAELEKLNSQITSQQEMDNNKEVADSSNQNAKVTAQNWKSGFQAMADASYQAARIAIDNMNAVETGGKPTKGKINVQYQGSTGKTSEATINEETKKALDAEDQSANTTDWTKIANTYMQLAENAGAAAADIDGMIAEIGAQSKLTDYGLGGVSKGLGTDNKKGKDKDGKDPDKMDYEENEADRYHEVNTQLDKISNQLEKIQSQEKKLIGKELIENLNAQLGKLDERLDNLRAKMGIALGEAAELRNSLSTKGVSFNSDGTVANYMQVYQAQLAYVNGLIAQYNAMSAEAQEGFKETVETAKKNFEKFVEDLENYDTLISDTLPGLQNEIQDVIDEQIELNIKKFNMEFEIRLDLKDAEKDWNEFKKRILDGIDEDDIYGNARARAVDDFGNMIGPNGVQNSTKRTEEVLEELRQMDATGWSDVYGDDRASALEDLKEAYKTITEDLIELDEIQKDVHQAWLDTMDDINEKMEDQVAMYEQITNLIEHDMKVIELVYGEEDYEALGKYYEKQHDNYLGLLDFQKQNVEFWEKEMNSIVDKNSEEWKIARDNWIAATNDLNATIEATIENARAKMENAIDDIFDKFNDQITNGMGLDYMQQQWDLVNDNADDYLDTINEAYALRQLESKYQDAIDNTDNISAQRKLNKLMEEELKALKEKDKLTQYDIDRANKKYEIALKQIALEEAQQTKNTMRLRRDSQGNYRYEYVADEDNIQKLKDELDTLENSLYNFDKERWIEMQNQVVDAVRERQEAIKEIMMDASLTEEERIARLEEINELYNEKIQNITDMTMTAQINMYDSGTQEIEKIWQKAIEDELAARGWSIDEIGRLYEEGILHEIAMREFGSTAILDNWLATMQAELGVTQLTSDQIAELFRQQGVNFQSLNEEQRRILLEEMLPQFDTGVNQMIEKFAGPGGFKEMTVASMEALSKATLDYKADLEAIQQAANVSFSNIRNAIDPTITKTQQLIRDNDALNREYTEQIQLIKDLNTQLQYQIDKYSQISAAAKQAADEAHRYWVQQQEQAAADAAAEKERQRQESEKQQQQQNNNNNNHNSGGSGNYSGGGNGVPEVGEWVTYVGDWYYHDSYGSSPAGQRGPGKQVKVDIVKTDGRPYPIHVVSNDSAYGWLKKEQLSGYDTGGYTGDWVGDYGKLALLHNKELVLNEHDTKNMLDMMKIARSVIAASGARALEPNAGKAITKVAELEQNVHIEANFPNVESASEIEEALNNLVQMASQRASRNLRG